MSYSKSCKTISQDNPIGLVRESHRWARVIVGHTLTIAATAIRNSNTGLDYGRVINSSDDMASLHRTHLIA